MGPGSTPCAHCDNEPTVRCVGRLGQVPALDGLRGLAIALVLGMHADRIVPGGQLGVDLFFVLSGFLITSLLIGEWSTAGTVSLQAFYRRRVLRLVPAFVAMLTVFLVAIAIFRPEEVRSSLIAAVFGIAYLANVAQAGGLSHAEGLTPLWSLATEEQFYLLWPPILFVALRRGVSTRSLMIALAGAAFASCVWRVVLMGKGTDLERLWWAPDTHADPILIGCIAGMLFATGRIARVRGGELALVAGAVIISMGAPEIFGLMTPFAIACAVVILVVALEPGWWFARMLALRPLRYLGRISYALYLWHLPIFVALGWKAGMPVAILAAAASYHFVESPFLRRRHRGRVYVTGAGSDIATLRRTGAATASP